MSNFDFLRGYAPLWAALGSLAEKNHPSDPNTTVTKLRILCEQIAERLAGWAGIDTSEVDSFDGILKLLARTRSVPPHVLDDLHLVRITGNKGAHDHRATPTEALDALRASHQIASWFYCSVVDSTFTAMQFVDPAASTSEEPTVASRAELVLRRPATDQAVLAVAMTTKSKLNSVGVPTDELDGAINSAKRRMEAARAPFRLGVAGEMNSGKSTLINALAGDRLAFVSELEATPISCRFSYADSRYARFVFRDGGELRLTVDEANAVIADRRHDEEWVSSIQVAEFYSPSEPLRDLEIWDSPGIGGAEQNDETANDFLTDTTGVVWVFDVQFLGSADHLPGLQKLTSARKRIIGVLNKVDLLDPEEVTALREEADLRYGAYIERFTTISARQALAKVIAGEQDPSLDDVRKVIRQEIIASAEKDRQERVDAALRESARELEKVIRRYRREFVDRLGFLDHVEHHLQLAEKRVMSSVAQLIEEASAVAFRGEQRAAENALAEWEERQQLGIRQSGGEDDGKSRTKKLKQLLKVFDRATDLNSAYKQAVQSMVDKLRARVDRECLDAIALSEAAIPGVRIPDAVLYTELEPDKIAEASRAARAWRHGKRAGLLVAMAFGIAGFFAPPLWLGLVSAVPVGIGVAWKTYSESEEETNFSYHQAQIISFADRKREYLRKTLVENFPVHFEAALSSGMMDVVANWTSQVLQHLEKGTVNQLSANLQDSSDLLARAAFGDATLDGLAVRPLQIPIGAAGHELWRQLVASTQQRLHVILPRLWTNLVPVLAVLAPDTELRVIAPWEPGIEEYVRLTFDGWKGPYELRCVRQRVDDKSIVRFDSTLLILDEGALYCRQPLSNLVQQALVFEDYPKGLLAAERLFAETWESKATEFGDIVVVPLTAHAGRKN